MIYVCVGPNLFCVMKDGLSGFEESVSAGQIISQNQK